ncbi:hypothetical protein QGN29_06825 [Temperatibacter marinus]|uniref:Uncharacterized protein n=1 Tax=Temperatibacter marinus TaxID=1456591 RepID=A0AA52HAB7_9PROT|nr:hypothetical protein [Temperatibacter marinus]WND04086.1 hypothetical protein QGN29_06825 [Temperatibacter marinus]
MLSMYDPDRILNFIIVFVGVLAVIAIIMLYAGRQYLGNQNPLKLLIATGVSALAASIILVAAREIEHSLLYNISNVLYICCYMSMLYGAAKILELSHSKLFNGLALITGGSAHLYAAFSMPYSELLFGNITAFFLTCMAGQFLLTNYHAIKRKRKASLTIGFAILVTFVAGLIRFFQSYMMGPTGPEFELEIINLYIVMIACSILGAMVTVVHFIIENQHTET